MEPAQLWGQAGSSAFSPLLLNLCGLSVRYQE